MVLKTQQFVGKMLEKAEYKFDEGVKEWAGWVRDFPGVYSQRPNIENVRQELAEMLEEYLFISIQEKKKLQGFVFKIPSYVKTNQSQRIH